MSDKGKENENNEDTVMSEEDRCKRERSTEDNDDDGHRRKRRQKKKKLKLFGDSGQTDAERRVLRKNQRSLYERIANDRADTGKDDEDDDGDSASKEDDAQSGSDEKNKSLEFLGRVREENNALWKEVRYTREAMLDAENVDLIANKYVKQVDRLVQVPRYDPLRLVQKLRQQCSNDHGFDWKVLGREVGICFDSLPSNVSFLAGVLDGDAEQKLPAKEKKTRRRKVAQKEDDEEEESPEKVERQKTTADQLSAGEKTMKVINKTLKRRTAEVNDPTSGEQPVGNGGVDGLRFLFNPNSFTQTVENIFHFSFLIKKGEAEIGFHDPARSETEKGQSGGRPGLYVKSRKPGGENPETKQSILTLSMKDWQDLVKAAKLKKGDLPHRTGSKYATKKLPSQEEEEETV